MRVLLCGGGTGGHVMPLSAIASKLKNNGHNKIMFVGQHGDKFASGLVDSPDIDASKMVMAGKFRRYAGVPWWRQLLDIPTVLLNIRDAILVAIGFFQSLAVVASFKPDVVFIKGGFVGVPVGLAGGLLGKKIITHDSDAYPGLANRIIQRWVTVHTVGMPTKHYNYAEDKTIRVGIPTADVFRKVSASQQAAFKQKLGFKPDRLLILITGGSQGAQIVNKIVVDTAKDILNLGELEIAHIAGPLNYDDVSEKINNKLDNNELNNYHVFSYIKGNMYEYSGAADIIISRGGSAIAEFAAQQKTVIIIPGSMLAGDHQSKNAKIYNDAKAGIVVNEKEAVPKPDILVNQIRKLVETPKLRQDLAKNLHAFFKLDATDEIVKIIKNTYDNKKEKIDENAKTT